MVPLYESPDVHQEQLAAHCLRWGKAGRRDFFFFLLQGFFCVQLWSIIIKCLLLDGRGALSKTAIHQALCKTAHI